ncbi:peroxide stress protein YaaA [Pseudoflavonifractor sp. An85]|uniref:peroxide stress protein YaaA n=1 Tax=Pseudoflavonifractor sp. An85 TaxID=1965661 RepID=UPI000B38632D|nr:peroxide stress protein YaaA [Pseudoflavonifractor sp. An85]OUN23395.1 hypothetical protein B5G37_08610 [Pseudoflavonifractor sp. An85]
MKIIISPAKKMRVDTDTLPWKELPAFLQDTERLCKTMQGMSDEGLKKLWKCNDAIAKLNVERLRQMDLRRNLTPAVLAYEGIQYRYMAPGVFTQQEYDYIQDHLRILSGSYGVLKPFDGVTSYRLEMQAKLRVGKSKNLYEFWGVRLAQILAEETNCILNLASKEYSVAISKHLPAGVRWITCVFGEEKDGRVMEKGTACKMTRGEMVRFLAQNQVTRVEEVTNFDGLDYHYDSTRSDENTFVFLRHSKHR